MHFKLGLYEHQSAGALEGAINALVNNPELVSGWTPVVDYQPIPALYLGNRMEMGLGWKDGIGQYYPKPFKHIHKSN